MADKITVKAEKREGRGKNDSRRMRVQGRIPVVIYGGGTESVSASAELKELAAVLRTDAGVNSVFSLDIAGEGVTDVIFQDRQIDSIHGRLVHADLRRFAKGEKIEMTVPIHLLGDAAGLSEEGAVLSQALREIKVLCEPANTPDSIDFDVTNLNVGESVHVSDLKVGAGIEIHEEPETVVASIIVVQEEELEPQTEAAGEPELVDQPGGESDNADGGGAE
jgi:large subunit ribosomal protein L25